MGDQLMEGKRRVKVPHQFICAITQEIMLEPVIAEDGHTYEKHAIENWLAKSPTSPMTRQNITAAKLIPNLALKQLIDQWKEDQRKGKGKAGDEVLSNSGHMIALDDEEENDKWRLVDEEELHDALERTTMEQPRTRHDIQAKELTLSTTSPAHEESDAEESFGTSGWLAFAGAVAVVAGGVAWAASSSSSSSSGAGEVKRKVRVEEDANSCILS